MKARNERGSKKRKNTWSAIEKAMRANNVRQGRCIGISRAFFLAYIRVHGIIYMQAKTSTDIPMSQQRDGSDQRQTSFEMVLHSVRTLAMCSGTFCARSLLGTFAARVSGE